MELILQSHGQTIASLDSNGMALIRDDPTEIQSAIALVKETEQFLQKWLDGSRPAIG